MIFGRTVDIHYDVSGAYATCSYKGNEEFLNAFFDELKHMGISDGDDEPALFLEPILKAYFKNKAYTDFKYFLVANGYYSDSYMYAMVTNPSYYEILMRVSAVICSYRFIS